MAASMKVEFAAVLKRQEEIMGPRFVCDMSALTPEQRARHGDLARRLRSAVREFNELPDGYAARLPADTAMILLAAEFITLERLCCPFFAIGLTVDSGEGPLWLTVTGKGDIKPFIRAEFSIPSTTVGMGPLQDGSAP